MESATTAVIGMLTNSRSGVAFMPILRRTDDGILGQHLTTTPFLRSFNAEDITFGVTSVVVVYVLGRKSNLLVCLGFVSD